MEKDELTMDELNFVMGGNDSLNQIVSLATNLYEQGYTKEEVVKAFSQKFDVDNQILMDTLNSMSEKYNNNLEQSPMQR